MTRREFGVIILDGDMAVVDTSLRVHGFNGLRVADSSVMPSLVSGTPTLLPS